MTALFPGLPKISGDPGGGLTEGVGNGIENEAFFAPQRQIGKFLLILRHGIALDESAVGCRVEISVDETVIVIGHDGAPAGNAGDNGFASAAEARHVVIGNAACHDHKIGVAKAGVEPNGRAP